MPINPKLKKTLNTFLNPLALKSDEYYSITGGKDKLSDALGHAGTLALGYGGAAALIRAFMADTKRKDTEKLRKRVASHLAASNPIMSLDPHLDDTEEEIALRQMGLQKEQGMPFLSALWKSYGKSHWSHPALALGAAGMGTYLGYKSMGKKVDEMEKSDIDERIAELRNRIDKQLLEEYRATRGLDAEKTAGEGWDDFKDFWGEQAKSVAGWSGERAGEAAAGAAGAAGAAIEGAVPEGTGAALKDVASKTGFTAGAAYTLYALIAGALGYRAVKKFADAKDPKRRELERVADFAKRQAITRKAPQFLDVTGGRLDMVDDPNTLMKKKQIGSTSMEPKISESDKQVHDVPVDANDPVASLLGG